MHFQPTLLLTPVLLLLPAVLAVDIRFYTRADCKGSFSAWNGVSPNSCFATSNGGFSTTRSVGFADLPTNPEDAAGIRLVGYTGTGGCEGGTVAFEQAAGGRAFVCSTAGSYSAAGVYGGGGTAGEGENGGGVIWG
ncbi:hypothetical protein Micbo1qcDRAFT_210254 [Microdochium bolleyi]|uniref:Uncharacterized protein n=1 Tax=Microdochium bolleyi TaxID=196109 RepID=A0A136IJC0_9PEZI|nr:hypothetical protein Micbo1qcDRAFT_210254 [Microdochium bolleyi]